MDFIQTKIQNLQKLLQSRGLYDIRVLTLLGIGFIALSVFWNGAKIVQQNYELAQKVAAIEEENEILELENRNKELHNQYLATDEFADITARRVYGKALPGERVYIVPRDVALSALENNIESEESVPEASQKPQYQKNLEAWLSIYFGD